MQLRQCLRDRQPKPQTSELPRDFPPPLLERLKHPRENFALDADPGVGDGDQKGLRTKDLRT